MKIYFEASTPNFDRLDITPKIALDVKIVFEPSEGWMPNSFDLIFEEAKIVLKRKISKVVHPLSFTKKEQNNETKKRTKIETGAK